MNKTERTCRELGWILSSEIHSLAPAPFEMAFSVLHDEAREAFLTELELPALRYFNVNEKDFSHETSWSALAKSCGIKVFDDDLAIPPSLPDDVRSMLIALRIIAAKGLRRVSTGGCRAFWTPEEYAKLGFRIGHEAVCVIMYDGGCLAPYFNWSYEDSRAVKAVNQIMDMHGFWTEQLDGVTSSVYRKSKE